MKLGEKSHRKIEDFFREYLADERFVLPAIHFYGGRLTHLLTAVLRIEGLTLGRRIYIFPRHLRRSESRRLRLNEELAVHEITHVLQYRREGFFGFLWRYLKSYWKNLRRSGRYDRRARALAYWEIPFEVEARRTAADFAAWSRRRKLAADTDGASE